LPISFEKYFLLKNQAGERYIPGGISEYEYQLCTFHQIPAVEANKVCESQSCAEYRRRLTGMP